MVTNISDEYEVDWTKMPPEYLIQCCNDIEPLVINGEIDKSITTVKRNWILRHLIDEGRITVSQPFDNPLVAKSLEDLPELLDWSIIPLRYLTAAIEDKNLEIVISSESTYLNNYGFRSILIFRGPDLKNPAIDYELLGTAKLVQPSFPTRLPLCHEIELGRNGIVVMVKPSGVISIIYSVITCLA